MTISPEDLFRAHFLPHYPEDALADLARARSTDANPGNNSSILAHLDEAARLFAQNAPALFGPAVELDFTDASVHRLSAALTPERRDALIASGELFDVVIHGSAYVGACIVARHGGVWAVRRPLWESLVRLKSRAGEAELAVFHWWLKSLSCGPTLADRYRTHVEAPSARAAYLPVIVPEERRLPRLSRPRYDVLHKYLKAHVPEIRDVGADFPSPERFAELRLAWLDFLLVGGGRMLLLGGPGEGGLHLIWLTGTGFEKSVFLPADPFPEPIVRVNGEMIEAFISVAGAPQRHEMLWSGP
jgi:hypothetical protein